MPPASARGGTRFRGAAKRHPDEKRNPQVRGADLGDPDRHPSTGSAVAQGSPVCGFELLAETERKG